MRPDAELRAMVVRDRNHPSVIAWSLCNEANCGNATEGRRLLRIVKALECVL